MIKAVLTGDEITQIINQREACQMHFFQVRCLRFVLMIRVACIIYACAEKKQYRNYENCFKTRSLFMSVISFQTFGIINERTTYTRHADVLPIANSRIKISAVSYNSYY